MIIDGQVVGRWRRVATPRAVTIDAQLGRVLSSDEFDALTAAVERYAQFLDLPTTLGDLIEHACAAAGPSPCRSPIPS